MFVCSHVCNPSAPGYAASRSNSMPHTAMPVPDFAEQPVIPKDAIINPPSFADKLFSNLRNAFVCKHRLSARASCIHTTSPANPLAVLTVQKLPKRNNLRPAYAIIVIQLRNTSISKINPRMLQCPHQIHKQDRTSRDAGASPKAFRSPARYAFCNAVNATYAIRHSRSYALSPSSSRHTTDGALSIPCSCIRFNASAAADEMTRGCGPFTRGSRLFGQIV